MARASGVAGRTRCIYRCRIQGRVMISSRKITWTQAGEPDEVLKNLKAFATKRRLCVGSTSVSRNDAETEVWADVSGSQADLDELDSYAYLRLVPDPN